MLQATAKSDFCTLFLKCKQNQVTVRARCLIKQCLQVEETREEPTLGVKQHQRIVSLLQTENLLGCKLITEIKSKINIRVNCS